LISAVTQDYQNTAKDQKLLINCINNKNGQVQGVLTQYRMFLHSTSTFSSAFIHKPDAGKMDQSIRTSGVEVHITPLGVPVVRFPFLGIQFSSRLCEFVVYEGTSIRVWGHIRTNGVYTGPYSTARYLVEV